MCWDERCRHGLGCGCDDCQDDVVETPRERKERKFKARQEREAAEEYAAARRDMLHDAGVL